MSEFQYGTHRIIKLKHQIYSTNYQKIPRPSKRKLQKSDKKAMKSKETKRLLGGQSSLEGKDW